MLKSIGVYLSINLPMECHITNICKSIYLEIRRLKQMSNFIDENSLKTLAASFILSRLDYCNSVLKQNDIGLFNKFHPKTPKFRCKGYPSKTSL